MQPISGAAFRRKTLHPLAGVTVLQVLAELGTSPAARAAIETAEALARVGGIPLVAARRGPMVSELQARGGIFVPFRVASSTPIALVRLIRAEAIDIVHARSPLSAWVALGAARLTRVPLVTSFPGCPPTGNALVACFNSIMARGDRVLAEWDFSARWAETFCPAAKGRTHVIGPGVDRLACAADAVTPGRVRAVRKGWNSPPDEPVALFLAELEPAEAQEFLGATARMLQGRGLRSQRLVYVEAGSGTGGSTIDPGADSPRSVRPCDDLPAAVLAASVVAIPSGRDERYCRLAVEAQAMGKPVIVADDGALAETVLAPPGSTEALRTGWRLPSAEPEALATAIQAALELGASARDRLSLRARAHVDQHLSTERMREETLAAFVAALRGEDGA